MGKPHKRPPEMDPHALLGDTVSEALDCIDIPSYILDASGRLRWANEATRRLIGDRRGQSHLSFVADDVRDRAKDHFARKVIGGAPATYDIAVVSKDGRRVPLRVRAAPLRVGGRVVGVLGLATPVHETLTIKVREDQLLTPRQIEILRFLAEGSNTHAIAAELGIAIETVRNHVRALLRRLGVHSRLEAVAAARRHGLLRVRDPRDSSD